MTVFADWEYLDGLKKQDPAILRKVYKEFYPSIRYYVLQNSGSEDDAADLFQETVIVIYKQVREGRKFDCSLNTYFISVARLQWLKELRRRKKFSRGADHDEMLNQIEDYSSGASANIEESEKQSIYQKAFLKLGADCRKILTMFYTKASLREIAEMMGFSEKYAKKRKFVCKEKLVRFVKADPAYKEWMNDE